MRTRDAISHGARLWSKTQSQHVDCASAAAGAAHKGGAIRVGEKDLSKLETHQRVAEGLAFVPQGRMIFPNLTVLENMMTAVKGKLEESELKEIYSLFPVLRDMKNRKGGNLSGGQQQQLAIARASTCGPSRLPIALLMSGMNGVPTLRTSAAADVPTPTQNRNLAARRIPARPSSSPQPKETGARGCWGIEFRTRRTVVLFTEREIVHTRTVPR